MVAAGLLALCSLLPFALGRPSASNSPFVVRDQRNAVPIGFKAHGGIPFVPSGMLRLTIAMPQGNATGLQAALLDVSDPTSDNYGHHLSKSEVEQHVAPKAESVQAVKDWLSKNNVTVADTSASGDMLTIQVPADQANTLLKANFTTYLHEKSNTTLVRTLAYSLPSELDQHVSWIYPTTQFIPPASRKAEFKAIGRLRTPSRRSQSKRADIPSQCAQVITPQCLQAIYNIPTTPATAKGNSLAVSGFDGETANPDDLKDFLSQARPDINIASAAASTLFDVQSVDGGSDDGQGTVEASLDIQYTVGLATNVPTTFVSVGEDTNDGGLNGFLDIINALLKEDNPPLVLTTSFGFDEAPFVEQAQDLAVTLCNAYAQLGARGTSVLFASGDGGVSGPQANDACDGAPFSPTFPSGCPFLTSVGSTQGINPETAAPFSSGGFSNLFTQPDYQADAVAGFLKTLGDTNAGLFNPKGRAFPDVSTQGVQFAIEVAGQIQGVDGTSASSPTFASVVALLNDALLNAGKAPLGFLNPMLYSQGAAALNDITEGSNPGCGTDGFPAVEGWDPVTGLGTPDFSKLLTLVTGSAATGQNSTGNESSGSNSTSTAVASESATAVATESATAIATESATAIATESASAIATESASGVATESASGVATESATAVATDSASAVATDSAPAASATAHKKHKSHKGQNQNESQEQEQDQA